MHYLNIPELESAIGSLYKTMTNLGLCQLTEWFWVVRGGVRDVHIAFETNLVMFGKDVSMNIPTFLRLDGQTLPSYQCE